jgi:hypothetical protein
LIVEAGRAEAMDPAGPRAIALFDAMFASAEFRVSPDMTQNPICSINEIYPTPLDE